MPIILNIGGRNIDSRQYSKLKAKGVDIKHQMQQEEELVNEAVDVKKEYEILAGKKPHHKWSEDKIKEEIAKLNQKQEEVEIKVDKKEEKELTK